MQSDEKETALTAVIYGFLTDGLSPDEACNTSKLVGMDVIIAEVRANWSYFAENVNVMLDSTDFTDEDFAFVIHKVLDSLATELG